MHCIGWPMEQKMITRLMKSPNIISIIEDGDVLFDKMIQENNRSVSIYADINHKLKNFGTIFNIRNKECSKKLKSLKLLRFFKTCLYENGTTQEKLLVVYVFLGIHDKCKPHRHTTV